MSEGRKKLIYVLGSGKQSQIIFKKKDYSCTPPPKKTKLKIVTLIFVLSRCREFGFSISRTEGICDRNRKLKRGRSPPLRRSRVTRCEHAEHKGRLGDDSPTQRASNPSAPRIPTGIAFRVYRWPQNTRLVHALSCPECSTVNTDRCYSTVHSS